ncbi:hypothetical protein LCGC14_1544170 [marine sediment metagenome]|uniref:Uncharacterized protein n=1 Tax=marine sediment metagenome TaxID=412755 RepID=A0A0F9L893_9ZZZZ
MKTEKEIKEMIETMKEAGRNSKDDIERHMIAEKMGTLTWVLK